MKKTVLKSTIINIIVILIMLFNIPVFAVTDSNNVGRSKITKTYVDWDSCFEQEEGIKEEGIKEDGLNYTLQQAELIDSTDNVRATYILKEKITKTFNSWEECVSFGPTIQLDDLQYTLTSAERIAKTERFTATYILEK